MKQINLFSGEKIPITDEKAKQIEHIIFNTDLKFFKIENEIINTSSISSIGEIETEKYWWGYLLDKTGRFFIRDGQKIYLEKHNFSQVEEIAIFEIEENLKIEEKKEAVIENEEAKNKYNKLKSNFEFLTKK